MTFTSRRLTLNAFVAAALLIVLPGAVSAAEVASKDEAVAIVKKAIAFHKANGKDKLVAEINSKNQIFIDRDLYVYVITMDGVMLAHPMNAKLVGKDLAQLKDADGKPFIQDILELAKAGKPGWVDYKWPNPLSKVVESKTTYTEQVGGLVFCAGVYR